MKGLESLSSATTATNPRRQVRSPQLALASLSLAGFSYAILQTILAPLLPRLASVLDRPLSTVTLTLTLPFIAGAVLSPLLGKYGDLHGKRTAMVGVLVAMTVGSIVAAITTNFLILLLARIVQGAGSGVFPLGYSIIRDELPPAKTRTGLAVFSSAFGLGSTFGIVLGGLIAGHIEGYRPVFWVAAAMSLVAVVAVFAFVNDTPRGATGSLDPLGALLLSGALVCLLLPMTEAGSWGWTNPLTISLLVGSAILGPLWAYTERRILNPLVDMDVFWQRRVLTTNLAGLLVGGASYLSFVGLSNFVQAPRAIVGYGFTADTLDAGLYLLPGAVVQLLVAPIVVVLARRFDDRIPIVLGGIVGSAGFLMFVFLHDTSMEIVLASAVMGGGLGMSFTALPGRVIHSVVRSQSGIASGMHNIMRTTGQAMGTTLIAVLLATNQVPGTKVARESGFTQLMLIGAIGTLVIVPLILLGSAHGVVDDEPEITDLLQPETAPRPAG